MLGSNINSGYAYVSTTDIISIFAAFASLEGPACAGL